MTLTAPRRPLLDGDDQEARPESYDDVVRGRGGDDPPVAPARPSPTPRVDAPDGARALSMVLALVSGILIFLVVNLAAVSQIEAYMSQKNLYSQLRLSLAEGSTPVSPLEHGRLVPLGTPVGVLSAPVVGLGRSVIVEGSGPGQTMEGIGHRRDTVLPCQVGTSVLMARAGAYGGIGSHWAKLQNGQRFTVTMGQGSCTYQVIDQRLAGDQGPRPITGRAGRLTLTTAAGSPFQPTGVLRVDADLVTPAYDRPAVTFPSEALPASEQAMGTDTSNLFALVLLMQLLLATAIGAAWLWRRWGRWQTWIVFLPVALTFGLIAATSLNYLLPNLL